jgi:hypothetical protein
MFKHYRQLNQTALTNKRLFFYRLNRWRFDPYDYPTLFRSNGKGWSSLLKIRYGVAVFVAYRFSLHYVFPAHH